MDTPTIGSSGMKKKTSVAKEELPHKRRVTAKKSPPKQQTSAKKNSTGQKIPEESSKAECGTKPNKTGEKEKAKPLCTREYTCRVMCFSGEQLWKPGEKRKSVVPLDEKQWELTVRQ